MHRFVGRSTIVAVALATTLGAGAALADTSGISPEALKSALGSTHTANPSFANALQTSTLGNRERFARYDLATADQSEFAALKATGPAGVRVGILAPEHNGDIQFAQIERLTPQHNGDIQFAEAGVLTPEHNGDIQLVRALADRPANVAFGETAAECEAAPIKLADVGAALRTLNSAPAITGDEASFAQALQLPESPAALGGYKRFTGNDVAQGSPAFAAIAKAIIQDGSSNTNFASLQVDKIAGIKMALNGNSDVSSDFSNETSASQLSSALRKR